MCDWQVFAGVSGTLQANVVRDVGCTGLTVASGDGMALLSGNTVVSNNEVALYMIAA